MTDINNQQNNLQEANPLKQRALINSVIVIVIMLITMGAVFITNRSIPTIENEAKIRGRVPFTIGDWICRDNQDRDMGESVYSVLRPDGIIWRTYVNSKSNTPVDFVLLVGTHSGAFHDPTLCFTNQGEHITSDKPAEITLSANQEKIPVRILRLMDKNGRKTISVYWWRSPGGNNMNKPEEMQMATLFNKLIGMRGKPAFFYRIITLDSGDEVKDMKMIEEFTDTLNTNLKTSYPAAAGIQVK